MTDFPPPGGFQPPGGPGPAPPPPPTQPGWAAPPPAAPPGATPYAPTGYQPGWAVPAASPQAHQSLKGLATAITAVLLLGVVAAIVAAMAFLSRASFVDDANLRRFNLSDAEDKDSAVRSGVGLFFLAFAVVAVLWIIWQFRHAKNAERLRGPLGLGPGWAIGGWFIPFGNFVIPALQLNQAAKASDPDLPSGAPAANGRAPAIIILWALAFDIAFIVFSASGSSRPSDSDLRFGVKPVSDFARADRGAAFGMFGFAVAAVIAVFLVRTLTDRQERAAATITPSAPTAPVYMPQPQYPQPQYLQPQQQPQTWGAPAPPPAAPPPPNQWGPPPTQ